MSKRRWPTPPSEKTATSRTTSPPPRQSPRERSSKKKVRMFLLHEKQRGVQKNDSACHRCLSTFWVKWCYGLSCQYSLNWLNSDKPVLSSQTHVALTFTVSKASFARKYISQKKLMTYALCSYAVRDFGWMEYLLGHSLRHLLPKRMDYQIGKDGQVLTLGGATVAARRRL